jgi:hypothetical protein
MTVEKRGHKHYVITDIVSGYRVTRMYLYYTKRQAVRLFKEEFKV